MNSKYLGIIGVVLLVLFGGYYLMKGQSGSQTPPPDTSSTSQTDQQQVASPSKSDVTIGQTKESGTEVEFTGNGFSPKSITVKVGTKVNWVNKGTTEVWVASAPHPQHTDLPGFDALKGYKPGESYSYTFTKVGNWKYHDHLAPKNFGVVNVEK